MRFPAALVLVLFSWGAKASQTLALDETLASAEKHYPSILQAMEKVRAARYNVMRASGAFDSRLDIEADARTDGYYNGKNADIKLVKPLQFLNSKIYAGHRVSEGEYPVYEGKFETLEKGENRLGLQMSLWRGAFADPKRVELWNAKLEGVQSGFEADLKRLQTLREAYVAYWNWVAKGEIFRIRKGLLDIALARKKALKRKVESGALAPIYQVENDQYVAQRKNQLIQSKRDLKQAAIKLGLYRRDKRGNPDPPGIGTLPQGLPKAEKIGEDDLESALQKALAKNPLVASYAPRMERQKNLALLGENAADPKLDFKVEVSRDRGDGPERLRGEETRLMLNFEIPLERNLGKGAAAKAKAKMNALAQGRRLIREQLAAGVRSLAVEANALWESLENIQKEIELAKTLERAERKKFAAGGSDFFVLNMRELNTAKAQEKLVKTKLARESALARFKEAAMEFQY